MQAKMGKKSPRLQYRERASTIGTVATKTPWDCGSSESSICPRAEITHVSPVDEQRKRLRRHSTARRLGQHPVLRQRQAIREGCAVD